jgi:hypothetical protein
MTFDREIPNCLRPDLSFLSLVFGSCEFADQRLNAYEVTTGIVQSKNGMANSNLKNICASILFETFLYNYNL